MSKWTYLALAAVLSSAVNVHASWRGIECSDYAEELRGGCLMAHQVIDGFNAKNKQGALKDVVAIEQLEFLWRRMVDKGLLTGYTLINTSEADGEIKALYKKVSWEEEGLVLLEVFYSKVGERWKVSNWEDYTLRFSGHERVGEIKKLSTGEGYTLVERIFSGNFFKALTSGQHDQVSKQYQMLTDKLKSSKLYQYALMTSSLKSSDEDYYEAISILYDYYGDVEGYEIIAAEFYIYQGNYDKARQEYRKINNNVGGDFHVEFIEGYLYEEEGDCKNLYTKSAEIIERYPDEIDGILLPVQCLLNEKRYKELVVVLEAVKASFDMVFVAEDFSKYPGAEDFFKSDIFLNTPGLQ